MVGLIVLGSQMNALSKLFEEEVSLMSHCTKGFDCNGYEIVGVFEMRILHLLSMLGFPGHCSCFCCCN